MHDPQRVRSVTGSERSEDFGKRRSRRSSEGWVNGPDCVWRMPPLGRSRATINRTRVDFFSTFLLQSQRVAVPCVRRAVVVRSRVVWRVVFCATVESPRQHQAVVQAVLSLRVRKKKKKVFCALFQDLEAPSQPQQKPQTRALVIPVVNAKKILKCAVIGDTKQISRGWFTAQDSFICAHMTISKSEIS